MSTSVARVLPVADPSQVGEARRTVLALGATLGLSEEESGRAALAATELATNLVKHAHGGELLLRPLSRGRAPGLEILSVDRGPGIASLSGALQDGVSTAGTPGNGLGAVRRVSSEFDAYSSRPGGTVVLARVWSGRAPGPAGRLEVAGVCVAHPAEDVSGDDWDMVETAAGARVMVVDGLGHGPFAREAAQQALSVFRTAGPGEALPAVLEACHRSLRATRGAAVALAEVDVPGAVIRFCGVGNIAGLVRGEGADDHLVSLNGTVGLGTVRAREFAYPWPAHGLIVLSSDGLQSHLGLDRYPGLLARHPAVVAAVLYRDHARGRDDATVVVLRERA